MHSTSWRKSSRSSNSGDQNCVEARRASTRFQVRDSKMGDASPVFDLDPSEFRSLLGAAR
jgi:hypothetical protein